MGSPMLGAKLFFLCGLVLVIAGFFLRPSSFPSIDIQVHESYFVVGHFHLLFLSSLALWLYAGFYYLGARLFALQFNNTLTILHLLVTTVALIGLNSFRYLGNYGTGQTPVSPLLVLSAPLGGALFLIGIAMFIVIVILATVARVRRAAV
jgi:heme/copper-type cytochrome/quinol oxidase subunit 1